VKQYSDNIADYAAVQEADYAYYGSGSTLGNPGDLELAQVKDAAGNVTDTAYYQYYLLAVSEKGS